MKIKHWQGYGSVNAFKVKDNSCDLHIKVVGNHEWGIERDDRYDAFNWLVKKFNKNIGDDDRIIKDMRLVSGSEKKDGLDVDTCDYYFNFYKD